MEQVFCWLNTLLIIKHTKKDLLTTTAFRTDGLKTSTCKMDHSNSITMEINFEIYVNLFLSKEKFLV